MAVIKRLVPLLSLCLGASATFKIYNATTLEDANVGDACVKAMSADIACPAYIRSFMQPRYRGSLSNFNTVVSACAGKDIRSGVPQRYGGYIWAGWNETCIKDPKTKKYCNNIIDEFTELDDREEIPREELCHLELEKVYKTYGGTGPTEVPPPPKVEEPTEYYLTNKYYLTKEGDTCDLIAKANPGITGVFLYIGNQKLIGDYRDLPAGLNLCLPSTCPTYIVKPDDTCFSIKRAQGLQIDDVEYYNSWINADYTNLHKATNFYGKSIYIGPFGARSVGPSLTLLDALVAKVSLKFSSANGLAVVLMDPPEEANVINGTTLKCGLWHVIEEGERCEGICAAHEIYEEDIIYAVNPSLPQNTDEYTKSLVPGEALCVVPIAGWDTTYESTRAAEE